MTARPHQDDKLDFQESHLWADHLKKLETGDISDMAGDLTSRGDPLHEYEMYHQMPTQSRGENLGETSRNFDGASDISGHTSMKDAVKAA
mmetsp:Transcript_5168/g.7968  ORF Transcript_5168/g.7968 Transcript_5168/m.7968 type:complete len:90 (+) Transcript_5168:5159-5428(+)